MKADGEMPPPIVPATKEKEPEVESETSEPAKKKPKVLEFEEAYLRNIPRAEVYEKSFMHRDVVTHVVATKTEFIVTVSQDGHLKFWKKETGGIEFVKHFRAHLVSQDGHLKFWKKETGGIEFVKHFCAHLVSQDGHFKFWKKETGGTEFVKHFRAHLVSQDGHLKFWKKETGVIKFVKHFRAHLGRNYYQSLKKEMPFTLEL